MGRTLAKFVGGDSGTWRVEKITAVSGLTLPEVARLDVIEDSRPVPEEHVGWVLKGVTSYERYVTGAEKADLSAQSPPLARPESTRAVLIPISKSAQWWDMPQDERRAIFEARSRHIATGMDYLPAVARRLYHGRDLGEPFDFLTWFEFAPDVADAFEQLVRRLRSTEEWTFVEREVEVRLVRV